MVLRAAAFDRSAVRLTNDSDDDLAASVAVAIVLLRLCDGLQRISGIDIDAHFARARLERPELWNGQVLMMHQHRFDAGILVGEFLQTDFASFMAWRDWGFPDPGIINCFSMGALQSSDGAWIMGVMGAHTSAAGRIYFPAGTPDPTDIVEDKVDLAASVIREVAEEFSSRTATVGWQVQAPTGVAALRRLSQERSSALASR